MKGNRYWLGKYVDFRIVLVAYLCLLILAGLASWGKVVRSLYTFGRYLMTAGLVAVILGFIGMGVSGAGRYSDMSPIYRDVKVYEGFIKRATKFFKPFASLILGGLLTMLTGYLIIHLVI